MYSRKMLKYALQTTGMFGVNGAIVWEGRKAQLKNNAYYRSLPEDQQRKIYNNCILQKLDGPSDSFSAIQERLLGTNPDAHKNIPVKSPYKPSR